MSSARTGPAALGYLDGTRGVAALYVVVHHVWLAAYPALGQRPGCELCRDAPAWTGALAWGQLAVAVFMVVSGFSLALAPLRHGDRLPAGFGPYIVRRTLRIVPPYWAALALSCAAIVLVTGAHSGNVVTARSVAVHAALVQNVIDTPKPNGAFWSIAVEWQIYFVFPFLLLAWRHWGGIAMVAGITLGATAAYLAASHTAALAQVLGVAPDTVAPLAKLLYLRPHFLVLFAFGVASAHAVAAAPADRTFPWGRCGIALASLTLAVLLALPRHAAEPNWFWLDLLAGGAVALLFAGWVRRPAAWGARLLGSRALRWLGQSSYSLYLLHVPLLELALYLVVQPHVDNADLRFAALLAITLPAAVLVSRLFWRTIERPFMDADAPQRWRERLARLRPGTRARVAGPDVKTPGAA